MVEVVREGGGRVEVVRVNGPHLPREGQGVKGRWERGEMRGGERD